MTGNACPRPRPRVDGTPLPRSELLNVPLFALLPPRPGKLAKSPLPLPRDRDGPLLNVVPRPRPPRVPPSLEVDMVADERQTRSLRHVLLILSTISGSGRCAHCRGVCLCLAARVLLYPHVEILRSELSEVARATIPHEIDFRVSNVTIPGKSEQHLHQHHSLSTSLRYHCM